MFSNINFLLCIFHNLKSKQVNFFIYTLMLIFVNSISASEPERDFRIAKLEGAEFVQLDNGYRVWTKRFGTGPIKILTLHGGPGLTHEYLECMEKFFPKDQFQIIFYDQLGSYYSDQPNDPSLWTIDRFCEEIEQVRKALGLNNFYLYGHSWGGLLAIEYSLKYQHHLKGVSLAGITASADSYVNHFNYSISQLPFSVKERLKSYEDSEDILNPEYEKLLFEEVYSHYFCRSKPWPEPLQRSFCHLNTQVSQIIQGPSEYKITGNSKDWNRWNDLSKITIPTLLICGKYDTMDPNDLEKMGSLIPNSQKKICEHGSHFAFYDDQENYFKAIHNFLNDTERLSKFPKSPRLHQLLNSYFSEEERKRIEISPLTAGWNSAELYCLSLDDKNYVARFLNSPQETCKKECYMIEQASMMGVTPSIHYIDKENSTILMDYINNATTISFEEAKRLSSIQDLGNTLRKTHSIQPPPYPLERLSQKVQRDYDSLRSLGLLNEQMRDIMKTLQNLFHELDSYNYDLAIIHGDLHVKNIFLTETGSILFIDWEGVRYDDPFFDIAYSTCTLTFDAEQELIYLSTYLGRTPNLAEKQHYQLCKKITVLAIYFELLKWAYHQNGNAPISNIQEPPKDWNWFMERFVASNQMPDAQFIYNWAQSVLKLVPLQ